MAEPEPTTSPSPGVSLNRVEREMRDGKLPLSARSGQVTRKEARSGLFGSVGGEGVGLRKKPPRTAEPNRGVSLFVQ